jgi:hypothetical protein
VEEDFSATSQNDEDTQDGDEDVISNDSEKSTEQEDSKE